MGVGRLLGSDGVFETWRGFGGAVVADGVQVSYAAVFMDVIVAMSLVLG